MGPPKGLPMGGTGEAKAARRPREEGKDITQDQAARHQAPHLECPAEKTSGTCLGSWGPWRMTGVYRGRRGGGGGPCARHPLI